jgi:hypothetical protein
MKNLARALALAFALTSFGATPAFACFASQEDLDRSVVMDTVLRRLDGQDRPEIESLRVKGDGAHVIVAFGEDELRVVQALTLARTDDGWRVVRLTYPVVIETPRPSGAAHRR